MANKIPVYMVNGFLESGKTTFIQETLSDPYFSDGGKTLLIACEEGEEEYDLHILESYDVTLVSIEGKAEFTREFLEDCQKKYKPSQVMIEWNGMWGMQLFREMDLPRGWFYAQGITLVDAGTFDLYMQNMKSLFMDMVQDSDLVIFDRCVEGTKAASYKRNIRAVIRFKGRVMKPRRMTPGYFVPGRKAMTCCADDTVFLGFLCRSHNVDKLKNGQWLTVTAKVYVEKRDEYSGEEGPVLYTKALKSAEPPEEEMVYF